MGDIGTKVLEVPLRGGVNTFADKHSVQAPDLTWAQNVVLDTEGLLRKRHGYVAISNDDPRVVTLFDRTDGMASYNGGLVAFAGEGHVWARAIASDDMMQAEVGFAPVARTVIRRPIGRSADAFGATRGDIAYESASGILAATYVVLDAGTGLATASKAVVTDYASGNIRFYESTKLNTQRARVLNVGQYIFWILPSSNSATSTCCGWTARIRRTSQRTRMAVRSSPITTLPPAL